MKKSILFLSVSLLYGSHVLAASDCFIAREKQSVLKEEGDCTQRHSPCSTFKIAISLMGYNEGILIDETHPSWPYKAEYANWFQPILDNWKQKQDPTTWMKNSVVWYSQVITKKLGAEKLKRYVSSFNYGNKDVSGDKGKDNSLTHSWINSSLKISGEEQVAFLQELSNDKLPVTKKSQDHTTHIIYVENLPNSWKLYGKTGTGNPLKADGTYNEDLQVGWFVGWIEKGGRKITFANYIEDKEKHDTPAGRRAKEAAKEKLLEIIHAK